MQSDFFHRRCIRLNWNPVKSWKVIAQFIAWNTYTTYQRLHFSRHSLWTPHIFTFHLFLYANYIIMQLLYIFHDLTQLLHFPYFKPISSVCHIHYPKSSCSFPRCKLFLSLKTILKKCYFHFPTYMYSFINRHPIMYLCFITTCPPPKTNDCLFLKTVLVSNNFAARHRVIKC